MKFPQVISARAAIPAQPGRISIDVTEAVVRFYGGLLLPSPVPRRFLGKRGITLLIEKNISGAITIIHSTERLQFFNLFRTWFTRPIDLPFLSLMLIACCSLPGYEQIATFHFLKLRGGQVFNLVIGLLRNWCAVFVVHGANDCTLHFNNDFV